MLRVEGEVSGAFKTQRPVLEAIPIQAVEIGGFDFDFGLMALSGLPRFAASVRANFSLAFRCCGV